MATQSKQMESLKKEIDSINSSKKVILNGIQEINQVKDQIMSWSDRFRQLDEKIVEIVSQMKSMDTNIQSNIQNVKQFCLNREEQLKKEINKDIVLKFQGFDKQVRDNLDIQKNEMEKDQLEKTNQILSPPPEVNDNRFTSQLIEVFIKSFSQKQQQETHQSEDIESQLRVLQYFLQQNIQNEKIQDDRIKALERKLRNLGDYQEVFSQDNQLQVSDFNLKDPEQVSDLTKEIQIKHLNLLHNVNDLKHLYQLVSPDIEIDEIANVNVKTYLPYATRLDQLERKIETSITEMQFQTLEAKLNQSDKTIRSKANRNELEIIKRQLLLSNLATQNEKSNESVFNELQKEMDYFEQQEQQQQEQISHLNEDINYEKKNN